MKKMIETWCYGTKKSFKTKNEAKKFYLEGIKSCEGAERDRYVEIYTKLQDGIEPYCDCDGIPAKKAQPHPITDKDIARAKEIIAQKKTAGDKLDALRAKLEEKKREFNRQNAALLADISSLGDECNNLFLELIKLEKRGLSIRSLNA